MLDYNNTEPEIKQKIATAEDTPVEVLQKLSKDSDRDIRSFVASNPNTPVEVLLKLGEEFPDAIIKNPIFSLLLLEDPDSLFVKKSLARSSTTAIATLEKLVSHGDLTVSNAVIEHPKASNIAIAIVQFKYRYEKQDIPVDVLEILASARSHHVRAGVAQNLNTPVNILDKLASARSRHVRRQVANNPQTPANVLYKFVKDGNSYVVVG